MFKWLKELFSVNPWQTAPWPSPPEGVKAIKVFQVDEDTWVAGEDAKACQIYHAEYTNSIESIEVFGDPVEVTDEELNRRTFVDDENDIKTWREELDELIVNPKVVFPIYFAGTTES